MVSDKTGRQLHDRATRGEELSVEEQSQLQRWYDAQDRAESDMLNITAPDGSVTALQAQVDSALQQLAAITHRLQEIAAENDALRNENAELRRQVADRISPQPA
ncbi:MAG: hypothetical protein L0229_02805 [Blastocatellia bacterium]|nr:hypothetical protein [Blastocatellia bacterium]